MPSKKPSHKHRGLHSPPDLVPDSLVDAIRDESHLAMALVRELGLDQPIPLIPGIQVHIPPVPRIKLAPKRST